MLSHNMSEQTKLCGTVYKVAVDVTKVDLIKKEVVIDEYETVRAKNTLIATLGPHPNIWHHQYVEIFLNIIFI